jgi:ribose 5-phosphate isomerase A
MSLDSVKKAVGKAAAGLIQSGMVVGLGSGSTAHFFIQELILRQQQEGLTIRAVASSNESYQLAQKGGIPLLDINQISSIDITVDGADEIDTVKRLIKGGGGALVREKIVASMSRELVVIVDETKLVSKLGKRMLPVEIIPFGIEATRHHLEKLGYAGHWRKTKEGSLYLTDNGNFILDIQFHTLREEPENDHEMIRRIPGVVDTGFFFHLAGRVIVGFSDGQVAIKN